MNTKIGDVFSVRISENEKKYMQYIITDQTQLNSDVIRAFKKIYSLDAKPELAEIINGEVEFYAHCTTKWGIKMGLWEKIGNIKNTGDTSCIVFRRTPDYGHKIGEKRIEISQNWNVWSINDADFTKVDKLVGDYRKAEIGVIVSPVDIVTRMKTGKYDFFYPGFE